MDEIQVVATVALIIGLTTLVWLYRRRRRKGWVRLDRRQGWWPFGRKTAPRIERWEPPPPQKGRLSPAAAAYYRRLTAPDLNAETRRRMQQDSSPYDLPPEIDPYALGHIQPETEPSEAEPQPAELSEVQGGILVTIKGWLVPSDEGGDKELILKPEGEKPKEPEAEAQDELVESLTEREMEVLELIAEGLTNKEIAQRLFLAPTTVRNYASNVYDKLGVSNRTEAVAKARELGILPP